MPGILKLSNPLLPIAIIRVLPAALFVRTLLAALFLHALCAAQPALPESFVGRPEFINHRWSFEAGTVFYLQGPDDKSKTYIATAHHLFGPMGGLDRDYSPGELEKVVDSIRITDLVTGIILLADVIRKAGI